jgi:hypothetical protein
VSLTAISDNHHIDITEFIAGHRITYTIGDYIYGSFGDLAKRSLDKRYNVFTHIKYDKNTSYDQENLENRPFTRWTEHISI